MNSELRNLFNSKTTQSDCESEELHTRIVEILTQLDLDSNYISGGDLSINSSKEVIFHTAELYNFIEERSIKEYEQPNSSEISRASKNISDFNIWDYQILPNVEFIGSTKSYEIKESHHSKGCSTCKENGKITCHTCKGSRDLRCDSCNGRGEDRCSNCNGKGETRCRNCSGKGETKCFWCSGKGIKSDGSRCGSCAGRGRNPCSDCRNGYIQCNNCRNGYVTCYNCSGQGKVSCYGCNGIGTNECPSCRGYRSIDHYFVVHSNFNNSITSINISNPLPGFDLSKVEAKNFNISLPIFDIQQPRFQNNLLDSLNETKFYKQISSFFNFNDSSKSRLIKSKLVVIENKYFEVSFTFNKERYQIFFDRLHSNFLFNGKNPADQYELDLLMNTISSVKINNLSNGINSLKTLSKFNFINIKANELIKALNDTSLIYKTANSIKSRDYVDAENYLSKVSSSKKEEIDFEKARTKLYFIYLLNTSISAIICLIGILAYILLNSEYFNSQSYKIFSIIGGVIFIASICANFLFKNIHASRSLVLLLTLMLGFYIYSEKETKVNLLKKENELKKDFLNLKKNSRIIFSQKINDSIILVKPKGNEIRRYYIPIGKPYWEDNTENAFHIAKQRIYLDLNLDHQQFEILKSSLKANERIKVYAGEIGKSKYENDRIQVIGTDIRFKESENLVVIFGLKNKLAEFKNIRDGNKSYEEYFLDKQLWAQIEKGKTNNLSSTFKNNVKLDSDEKSISLEVGSYFQGGIIIQLNEYRTSGLIISDKDLGSGDWNSAVEKCSNYIADGYDDWRLPTLDELKIIYQNKSLVSNFEENWYWSSTEYSSFDGDNEAYHLGFIYGDVGNVPKEHGKFIRAIRSFNTGEWQGSNN